MRAFLNTEVTKAELISVLEAHALADKFMKGRYWDEGKGCAVGCSLEHFTSRNFDHLEYERLFGIPVVLAKLQDRIFEGLSNEDSKWWPVAFAQAIHEGADLSMVWSKFAVWLLGDKEHGAIRHAKTKKSKKVIQDVIDLYAKTIAGKDVNIKEWQVVRKAASDYAASDYASYAASYAAASASADAAAAADAADDADDAASSADDTYDWEKSKKRQADKLIQILKECK